MQLCEVKEFVGYGTTLMYIGSFDDYPRFTKGSSTYMEHNKQEIGAGCKYSCLYVT